MDHLPRTYKDITKADTKSLKAALEEVCGEDFVGQGFPPHKATEARFTLITAELASREARRKERILLALTYANTLAAFVAVVLTIVSIF